MRDNDEKWVMSKGGIIPLLVEHEKRITELENKSLKQRIREEMLIDDKPIKKSQKEEKVKQGI